MSGCSALHQHGVMIKLEHPVYLESSQCLVIRELDSLSINYIIYYENYQSFRYRIRSSSQRRLLRQTKFLCRHLRLQTTGRWLQCTRTNLDKLKSTACLHIRNVRQPSPRNLQNKNKQTSHQVPYTACLKHSTLTTNWGLYIPSFSDPSVVLSSFHHTIIHIMSKIYHITRPSLYVKHYWVNADNWKDACKNINNDKAHHESYDLIYHKAGYKSVSVTDSFGTYHQQNPHITTPCHK